MKKIYLILAVGLLTLTSCTKGDVLGVSSGIAIGFDSFVDKPVKATNDIGDLSTDFKELYVFASKGVKDQGVFTPDAGGHYMNEVKVTGGKGYWDYENHMPWIADRSFRFAAYANGLGDGSATAAKLNNVTFVPEEQVPVTGGTQSVWGLDIADYQVSDDDLIIAIPEEKTVTDLTSAPLSVGLTFKHALAKVIFQFRYISNASNANLSLEINEFEFDAFTVGDCKARFTGVFDTSVIGVDWSNQDVTAPYTFFETNNVFSASTIQSTSYVIPQSNATIVIPEIKIVSKNQQGEVTSEIVYSNVSLNIDNHTEWKPGYVYRYIADITPGEHYIHFTTSVTSWIDDDSRNQTIN